ncbi:MAG: PD40 domain-containing protein [Actinobacteria bacterium]|nr:PD40 domain-containing protein [Actinomycetota bacterium]
MAAMPSAPHCVSGERARGPRLTLTAALFAFAGLAAAALVALAAGPADAAFPGHPGLIAYDNSQQSGGGESEEDCVSENDSIFTARADGSQRTRLAKGVDPSYSPNGQLIAFSICDGIQSDLMVMNSDGTGVRAITSTPKVSEEEAAFSADGKRIYFSRDSGGEGYSQIYSIGVDGSGLRQLTPKRHETSDSHPAAAPNGRFVVFDREGELYTMRPNGTHLKKLTPGWDPAVSPTSNRIAYSFRGQIYLIGAAGGGPRQLTHLKSGHFAEAIALAPAFSPDGSWIAFALEESISNGPGFNDAQKLDKVSLRTGKVVTLTKTSVGGSHPDWQPLP